jgi:CRISPR type I-E-associated protein CasA/Cse1
VILNPLDDQTPGALRAGAAIGLLGGDRPVDHERPFNLVVDSWVPVLRADGTAARASLRDILAGGSAAPLRALAGDPPVAVAVLRLVIAVLHDALGGPGDDDTWASWWRAGSWPTAVVDAYLRHHQDRFVLFSDPGSGVVGFGQDPRVIGGRRRSIAELMPHRASGKNPVLWSHNTGLDGTRPLRVSAADAACWLIAEHQFSRAGMFPTVRGAQMSATQPPLTNRAVTYPVGASLTRTLLLNLTTYTPRAGDVPPWRRTAAVIAGPPAGLVSLLTWQTRCLAIFDDGDAHVREAVRAGADVDTAVSVDVLEALDPHLSFRTTRQGLRVPVVYDPQVAVWRVAADLVGGARRERSALGACARRASGGYGSDAESVSVETAGLAMASFSKPVDWVRATVPVTAGSQVLPWAGRAIGYAERAVRVLRGVAYPMLAVIGVRKSGKGHTGVLDTMESAIWSALERPGRTLLGDLEAATDDTHCHALLDGWAQRVDDMVFAVLTDAVAGPPTATAAMALAAAKASARKELATATSIMETTP